MKKKKRKHAVDDASWTLPTEAKNFIKKRVKALGSLEAVRRNYWRDDLVSKYAVGYAEALIRMHDGEGMV